MLTWPQNARNPISWDLNFKLFREWMPPDPRLLRGISNPVSKILYPPQRHSRLVAPSKHQSVPNTIVDKIHMN